MLKQAVESYLELRRAAGFEMKVPGGLLHNFARFATDRSEIHVQRQTAIDWAAQAPTPHQRERRLGMVRRFVDHARAEDNAHDKIPEKVFVTHQHQRPFPNILSPGELNRLLDATIHLRPKNSLRPPTYFTLFGLLASSGLRISEAIRLTVDDVTGDGLVIRQTKFRKSRLVPLHETSRAVLDGYLERRKALRAAGDHVFVSTQGRALTYPMINGTFHYLVTRAGLDGAGKHPRIHDLRHLFAVRALENAPCGSHDVVLRHALALSTFLGHAHVADTYWYLQTTPQLMKSVADACQLHAGGGQS